MGQTTASPDVLTTLEQALVKTGDGLNPDLALIAIMCVWTAFRSSTVKPSRRSSRWEGLGRIESTCTLLHLNGRLELGVRWSPNLSAPDDSRWVMRPENCVRFWEGEQHSLIGGLSLVLARGHFEGFQIRRRLSGAERLGVLLVGDQPFVCQDRRPVSFMSSYPNLIYLAPDAIRNIINRLAPFVFDRLYGAFPDQLRVNGKPQPQARMTNSEGCESGTAAYTREVMILSGATVLTILSGFKTKDFQTEPFAKGRR